MECSACAQNCPILVHAGSAACRPSREGDSRRGGKVRGYSGPLLVAGSAVPCRPNLGRVAICAHQNICYNPTNRRGVADRQPCGLTGFRWEEAGCARRIVVFGCE